MTAAGSPPFLAPALLGPQAAALRSGELPLDRSVDELCHRLDALEPRLRALLPEPGRRERLQRVEAALLARFPRSCNTATSLWRGGGDQGHHRCGRLSHPGRFGPAARDLPRAGGRDRPAPARRGRADPRQDGDDRVCLFRPGCHGQPAPARSHAGRIQQRLGGGGGRRLHAPGAGLADDRLRDPAGGPSAAWWASSPAWGVSPGRECCSSPTVSTTWGSSPRTSPPPGWRQPSSATAGAGRRRLFQPGPCRAWRSQRGRTWSRCSRRRSDSSTSNWTA